MPVRRYILDVRKGVKLQAFYSESSRRGKAHDEKREYDKAIAAFSRAIRMDPEEVDYLVARGDVYSRRGQLNQEISDYEKADQLSQRADYLVARGDAYASKAQYDLAVADYDEAIRLHPKLRGAIANRAKIMAMKDG